MGNGPSDLWRHFVSKKSCWTCLDFQHCKGKWTYKMQCGLPSTLLMNDISGARLPLDWLEPHEAEHTLRIRLAPDGNTAAELQFCKEQTLVWAAQLTHSKVPRHINWLNFKTVLLKKVEYPLMVTTFSRKECDDILRPALNAFLPSIGVNWHFPRDMIYDHNDLLGLAIPHLYDSQGFLHMSAMLKFGASPGLTGALLRQTYEILQLEVGLSGEILMKLYSSWACLCTKLWLTHTWQYALEHGWDIVTGLPSLQPKCLHNQFLMEVFWNQGYQGQKLMDLNHCRLWLQVTSLANIVDGHGNHMLPSILLGKSTT